MTSTMRKQAEQLVVGRVYAVSADESKISFVKCVDLPPVTIGNWFRRWHGDPIGGRALFDEFDIDELFELTPEEYAIYNKPSDPTFTLSDIQRVIERIENEMAECGYTLTEHGLRIAIEIMREELKIK